MTATDVLERVTQHQPVPGRHLVLVAHPDDEVISACAALCCLTDVVIVQLTQDTDAREDERAAAQQAAGWSFPVQMGGTSFRQAHQSAGRLWRLVSDLLPVDVLWTHPYEGGHLDHDTAAWIGQTVDGGCLRLEFASYHATETGQTFGEFWPDAKCPSAPVRLGKWWDRKRAALAAYESQAHIVRKFRHLEWEVYRQAPIYDFTLPAPPPRARWDVKGYQPSTAVWRETIAKVAA